MDNSNFFRDKLPSINKYIDSNTKTFKSNSDSREGMIVPDIVMNYGDTKVDFGHLKIFPKVVKTIIESKKSYSSITKNPNINKRIISDNTMNEFKSLAFSLGVSDIGFTKVHESMIFKNKEILFNNAIVLTMEMKREAIDLAPSLETGDEVFRTYLSLGKIVNTLSKFLRDNGFNVQGSPALNGDVVYPLLAQNAGMGATGKHGLLITPKLGPCLRIAAIFTDIENLPLNKTNDHLWIQKFCNKCNKCINTCPGKAILIDSYIYPDGSKKCIDYKKCAIPFSRDYGCTVCVKECVFYKNDYYDIKKNFI